MGQSRDRGNERLVAYRYLEAAPSDQSAGATWSCFRTEIPGARGIDVGTGWHNTMDMKIGCTTSGTAADLCSSCSLNGLRDWFLPSIEELIQMYLNPRVTGFCDFGSIGDADNICYWSSTQRSADMSWHLDFADNGRKHYDDKDYPRRVRAVRVF